MISLLLCCFERQFTCGESLNTLDYKVLQNKNDHDGAVRYKFNKHESLNIAEIKLYVLNVSSPKEKIWINQVEQILENKEDHNALCDFKE